MIVEKIEMVNFMCYSGNQAIRFSEGINVIIGDNGYGKSKLFDAFYWTLNDAIFSPEKKKFLRTPETKLQIISDKALYESTGEEVSAAVELTFLDSNSGHRYLLRREYIAFKKEFGWVPAEKSERSLQIKELASGQGKMVQNDEEIDRLIERVLPAQIKPYLWFQGEQVESIIDFNKEDTLTQAINVLSNISRYDEIKVMATAASKSARLEYDKEVRRLTGYNARSQELEKEKNKLELDIERLVKQEEEIEENLSRAEEKKDALANQREDSQKITVLKERLHVLHENQRERAATLQERQQSFQQKMFRRHWVLKGTRPLFEGYSAKFEQYDRQKLLNETPHLRLPNGVPEPIYIYRMLDEQKCLVCDREAPSGSEAYNKIKHLLDKTEKAGTVSPSQTARTEIYGDVKRLYLNGLTLSGRIDRIDEDIAEVLQEIDDLRKTVRDATVQIQNVDKGIEHILKAASMTPEQPSNIWVEYQSQEEMINRFTDQRARTAQKLEIARNNLRSVNDQLRSLVKGGIPRWLEEKRDVLSDLETIAQSTRDRVYTNLIQQLEVEANLHYAAMTAGNKSVKGSIKLKKLPNRNYMPEIIDEKGNPLLGSNTSNLILVKLAAIMAIVSANSTAGIVDFYTLITDAPTSVFGEDYTIGFCKAISKVYKQSIVMSKEFYKNEQLRDQLLKDPEINVGKVYIITPSIIESERANRNTLSTKIDPIK